MSDIENLDNVLKVLDSMADTEKLEAAMTQACLRVEKSAKEKAPKDTGNLRRSITSKVESGNGEVTGTIFTPLEYAPYIEYGTGLFAEDGGRMDVPWNYQDDKGNWHSTSGQKPQPFLRPALAENTEEIKKLLKEGLLNG